MLTYFGTISSLQIRRAAIGVCDHSLKSVKEGFTCPENKSEWEKRAQDFHCETYSQNCTDKSSFVYHCLINPWSNGTIEVCAPRIKIFDKKCTEFNKGGARVQPVYRKTCQLCPKRYFSSESYKYQECYKLDVQREPTTHLKTVSSSRPYEVVTNDQYIRNATNQTLKYNFGHEEQGYSIEYILPICLVLALLVILILILVYKWRKRNAHGNWMKIFQILLEKENSTEVPTNGLTLGSSGKENFMKETTNENVEVMPLGSEDRTREVQELRINTDLLKFICKLEDCKDGIDGLKEKTLQSPYHDKYAEYLAKNHSPEMNVTGNWREDIRIQAAADIFNVKIFVVQTQKENTITLFLPKDTNAERWMKISVDRESRYSYETDCDTCNEEEAKLVPYNDVYGILDENSEDEKDYLLKEDNSSLKLYIN